MPVRENMTICVDKPSPIKFEQILVEGEVTVGGMME